MNLKELEALIQPETELDKDFIFFVEHLLKNDMIASETAKGIARQVIDKGVGGLTKSQKDAFLKYGIYDNFIEECERCANPIPWPEMIDALDDSYCSYCRHIMNKD